MKRKHIYLAAGIGAAVAAAYCLTRPKRAGSAQPGNSPLSNPPVAQQPGLNILSGLGYRIT